MSSKKILNRILNALDRLSPPPVELPQMNISDSFIWSVSPDLLTSVTPVNRLSADFILGVESIKNTLMSNTRQFAKGLPANNALVWGSRGMGKSSLIKAVHLRVSTEFPNLKLIQIQSEELSSANRLISLLRKEEARNYCFILFCDDLSFSSDDTSYKSLKVLLDGGVLGLPKNVIIYATSNRRHLVSREMIENESEISIFPNEGVEEKVSLSDRFGLWLSVYQCDQNQYLEMIKTYCKVLQIEIADDVLKNEAIEWQQTRGSRSGRVAWQFIVDLAGRRGISLEKLFHC